MTVRAACYRDCRSRMVAEENLSTW
uniref:Uncharacterized protein n=1 Tax=Anguilla anguilla TaxID=7936 RepID=A0A0E9QFF4_ANGAN